MCRKGMQVLLSTQTPGPLPVDCIIVHVQGREPLLHHPQQWLDYNAPRGQSQLATRGNLNTSELEASRPHLCTPSSSRMAKSCMPYRLRLQLCHSRIPCSTHAQLVGSQSPTCMATDHGVPISSGHSCSSCGVGRLVQADALDYIGSAI